MDKVQLQDLGQGHNNELLYLKRSQPNPLSINWIPIPRKEICSPAMRDSSCSRESANESWSERRAVSRSYSLQPYTEPKEFWPIQYRGTWWWATRSIPAHLDSSIPKSGVLILLLVSGWKASMKKDKEFPCQGVKFLTRGLMFILGQKKINGCFPMIFSLWFLPITWYFQAHFWSFIPWEQDRYQVTVLSSSQHPPPSPIHTSKAPDWPLWRVLGQRSRHHS